MDKLRDDATHGKVDARRYGLFFFQQCAHFEFNPFGVREQAGLISFFELGDQLVVEGVHTLSICRYRGLNMVDKVYGLAGIFLYVRYRTNDQVPLLKQPFAL